VLLDFPTIELPFTSDAMQEHVDRIPHPTFVYILSSREIVCANAAARVLLKAALTRGTSGVHAGRLFASHEDLQHMEADALAAGLAKGVRLLARLPDGSIVSITVHACSAVRCLERMIIMICSPPKPAWSDDNAYA
jgi:hypothetical protein